MSFFKKFFIMQWSVLNVILAVIFVHETAACMVNQKCMTLKECRKTQKENKLPPSAIMDLSSSLLYPCEESPLPKICCTVRALDATYEEEDPGYTITSGKRKRSYSMSLPLNELHKTRPTLTAKKYENCGRFMEGNHEEDAVPGQFPWLAQLGNKGLDGEDINFHCGGSLINHRYILTSTYCLNNMTSPPDIVRLGEFDRSNTKDCMLNNNKNCPGDFGVEKIINHELFNTPFLKNDISLVKLKTPVVEYTEHIQPICLPTEPVNALQYTIAGWGMNALRKVNPSSTPKFGTLTLPNQKACSEELPIPIQPVVETQLCSGPTKSSCLGDAGGPMIAYLKEGETEYAVQVGIISYGGYVCNSPFTRELYTNVVRFMDWITRNTSD